AGGLSATERGAMNCAGSAGGPSTSFVCELGPESTLDSSREDVHLVAILCQIDGNSNQMVSAYLTPLVRRLVRCGWVTSEGHARRSPTEICAFVKPCRGKSSSPPAYPALSFTDAETCAMSWWMRSSSCSPRA